MAASQLITDSNNGEQIAIGSDMILVQYEGMLFKRQRGRSLRKGSGNRMKLKFQPRFCVLNNDGFMYKPKKSDKSKVCYMSLSIKSDSIAACMHASCMPWLKLQLPLITTMSHKGEGHFPDWKNQICQRCSSRCVQ
jgi:hypothetical protein